MTRISTFSGRPAWLLLLLSFPLASPVDLISQEASAAAQSAVAGARVFGEHRCVVCHTAEGLGSGIGPDLEDGTSYRDVYQLTATLWNHLPDMARAMDSLSIVRPVFSTREAGDLVAYLYLLGGARGSGSSARGAELYRSAACIRCHRVGDVGGVIGPSLDRIAALRSPHGLAAGLWNHSGSMIPKMQELGVPYPTLRSADVMDLEAFLVANVPDGERIPDADSWILPGDAGRGASIVEREGCADCHLVAGRGAGTAPELTFRGDRRTEWEFYAALWNKGPSMRAAFAARGADPPTFDPGEMADLAAYLQSAGYFVTSGGTARGREVARSSGCLRCHGWEGAGVRASDLAALAAIPEPASRIAALWNHLGVLDPDDPSGVDWSALDHSEMVDVLEFLGTEAR